MALGFVLGMAAGLKAARFLFRDAEVETTDPARTPLVEYRFTEAGTPGPWTRATPWTSTRLNGAGEAGVSQLKGREFERSGSRRSYDGGSR